jgi:hypothetical protein
MNRFRRKTWILSQETGEGPRHSFIFILSKREEYAAPPETGKGTDA